MAKGLPLDDVIGVCNYYEQELVLVIRHGQSNGELGKELNHYGEILFQAFEERLETLLKFIQPLLLSFVGLLVICMYLAILLPLFSMMNHL